jgi:hypothetical protein
MKKYIVAGVLVRQTIRRWLLREGIEFTEDKGLFNSMFFLNCSNETYKRVRVALEDWNKD